MAIDSIEEKEKRVMKLLEDGWNFKDIAKEEHVSFSFISTVNKKRLGQDPSVNKRLSIPTQALKLFSEGKSVIEVTIILDRPISEIQRHYNDYLRLRGIDFLVLLIEAHGGHLSTISKLIKYIVHNHFQKNDLIIALHLVKDINHLRNIKKSLEDRIAALSETRNHLINNKKGMNQFSY
jgi:hypothetical protein